MRTKGWMRSGALAVALAVLGAAGVQGATLSVEDAVKVALEKSTDMVNANANIRDAKGNVYNGYGGVLPSLSVGLTQVVSHTENAAGAQALGNFVAPVDLTDQRFNSLTPTATVNWGILDLSNWAGLSSAKHGLHASELSRNATRADVALATRRQYYLVVQSIKLADVAQRALVLSRDDERRVKAMFEVGSVSKSDLLKAQVRTAQSELDSITSGHAVTVQRINLATQMGIKESDLGDVDTVLTATEQTYDEPAILTEAAANRPDIQAAQASLKSAEASHKAARMARLPYVTMGGRLTVSDDSHSSRFFVDKDPQRFTNTSDWSLSGQIALNWDLFNLGRIDANIASAQARLDRSKENYDALQRNLQSEVHQQLLGYSEATEGNNLNTKHIDT